MNILHENFFYQKIQFFSLNNFFLTMKKSLEIIKNHEKDKHDKKL